MSDKTQKRVIKKGWGVFVILVVFCFLFFCLGFDLLPVEVLVEANEFVFNRVACYIKIKRDGVNHRRQCGWVRVVVGGCR